MPRGKRKGTEEITLPILQTPGGDKHANTSRKKKDLGRKKEKKTKGKQGSKQWKDLKKKGEDARCGV